MNILLKNGLIVTQNGFEKMDILIENNIIKNIHPNIIHTDETLYDISGNFVIPGGIDVHTHFNIDVGIKSVDNFYSGGIAAIYGGTTTIIDHPGFGPKNCALDHQIKLYKTLAKNSPIDYSFHGVIQHVSENIEDELINLKNSGITSVKLYMTYTYALNDSDIIKVFSLAKKLNIVICVHAENHDIIEYLRNTFINENKISPIYHACSRPDYSESEAVSRLLSLAKSTDFTKLYFVHISCKKSLDILKKEKEIGREFFVESCPQYLLLNEEEYLTKDGVNFILSPPLRKKDDNIAIYENINNGNIDVIGTDHCTFSLEDKLKGTHNFTICPNGIPGVQERIPLLFTEVLKGNITVQSFLNTCCKNPAKIFGIDHIKGSIKKNLHADLVILSLNKSNFSNPKSLAKYSCFKNKESLVSIEKVFLRGNLILQNNQIINSTGNFLCRK